MLKLIAKAPYAHRDDRDVCYIVYDKTECGNDEYIVWSETSTGDRYWGHYFPYANADEKEAMFRRAMKCFFFLSARRYGITIDEEEAFV